MSFDPTKYDPASSGSDIFETGMYDFRISKSEAKQTKDTTGTMLVLTYDCLNPEHAGRKLLIRLNLVNQNPQAVEIAYRELSAICHVVGIGKLDDSQQLHNRPFKASIEKMPRKDDPSKFNNEIRGYFDSQGNEPQLGRFAGGGAAAPNAAPPAPTVAAAVAPPAAPAAPPAAPAAPAAEAQPWAQPAQAAPAQAAAPQPWAQQPAAAPMQAPPPAAPQPAAAPPAAAPWAQPAAAAPAGAAPPWQTA